MSMLYLGRRTAETDAEQQVHYPSKHLTTHGLVFGMTGSGKTGLCIGLLEEASRANVPIIAIDPKGDLTNLVLSWPDLADDKFSRWVDPSSLDDGKTAAEVGASMARRWRDGLAADGLGHEDIKQLRESTRFTIYTPGSSSGVPVSMLERFEPPPRYRELPAEDRSDLISGVASAVLALVDVDADPLQSKEHILISNILTHAWDRGESLDIQSLIGRIDAPPFAKLGVFELDAFFPQKKRTALAMRLNALIASPSFSAWLSGEPLDIDRLLEKSAEGTRTSIFSIAHLDDAERMSFVALLLDRLVAWMRCQPGSGELRALLYFDEVFGYLPPHPKNPPSKRPLLTLLKQARAFGLGAVLATQNPVDVDYKAITNAGTWMIGKLQTDQDKERVLDGLMGSADAETGPTRAEVSAMVSALETRQFVLSSAHLDALVTFRTRFVMSYLRGPMTRQEIARLKAAGFYNHDTLTAAESKPGRPVMSSGRDPVDAAFGPDDASGVGPDTAEAVPVDAASAEPVDADFGEDPVDGAEPSAETLVTSRSAASKPTPKPAPPPTHPDGVRSMYLLPSALRVPDIADSLGMATAGGSTHPPTYVPALMASATYGFRTHEGSEAQTGRTSATLVLRPIPDTPDIHWRHALETDIDAAHLTATPERDAVYQTPPRWMFDPASCVDAGEGFREQLAAMRTLRLPAAETLGMFGRPDESLEAFRSRVADEVRGRKERAVQAIEGRAGQADSVVGMKIAELRELLIMDKRELAYHRGRGDDVRVERVVGSMRLRMDELRKLLFRRDRLQRASKREAADAEFAAMDTLSAVRLVHVPLRPADISVDFWGILWVPA